MTQPIDLQTLPMFGTILTLTSVLLPLALNVPSAEALMAGVIACKMAILQKPLLFVSARNEVDLLVGAHGD